MQTADHPVRIAFCIASRGRPASLVGVVMAAQRLQSGTNHIAFMVAADEDDIKTLDAIQFLRDSGEVNIHSTVAPREPYLAAAQNRSVQAAMGAEIVCLISDRFYSITPGYDIGIVDAAIRHPNRLLWFSCPSDPDTTMPIIPHTWLDVTDWRPLPEIFPYWFTDTWLAEIDRMCFGGPSLRIRPMYAGARQQTTRGREFEFWTRLYIALRPQRVEKAKRLSEAMGLTWADPPAEMLADFEARDRHLLQHAADFEERFGDKSAPGPDYLAAKAKAEDMLKEVQS